MMEMQDKPMIGFGILLPDELHNFVRELELKLFLKFNLKKGLKQSPHITFKGPFSVDEFEPYKNYFDELAKEITPFEITINGISNFNSEVVFLDILENPDLTGLHNKVLFELQNKFGIQGGEYEGDNVKFHATLAYGDLSDDIFNDVKQTLLKLKPSFTFTFKSIGLFYKVDDSWIIYRKATI